METEVGAWPEAAVRQARKASSRPVDLVHLSRYTLGERALEREVLDLFCTQSLVYLERLQGAANDQEWKDAAHSLKGSAQAIGAWRAAEAAERAEALAGDPLAGDALAASRRVRLVEIEASLGEARAYIRSLLKGR
jgi:HPt (histidine-containing phosphotransfer) domain-containing protein